jgi:hypothetical protein
VAWEALGHAMATYEVELSYAREREQFGNALASYQLVQDKLAKMLPGQDGQCTQGPLDRRRGEGHTRRQRHPLRILCGSSLGRHGGRLHLRGHRQPQLSRSGTRDNGSASVLVMPLGDPSEDHLVLTTTDADANHLCGLTLLRPGLRLASIGFVPVPFRPQDAQPPELPTPPPKAPAHPLLESVS